MYNKHKLNNGLRIVTEEINHVKSVTIGIWIKIGSRYEKNYNNGISHFIEHMLFKGTAKRSSKQIAEEIDNIGGQINAFTSKEYTCYYIKVLNTYIDSVLDILADILFNSNIDDAELIKERGVIHEEINMYEDSAEDTVHELHTKSIFRESSLGLPILGTEESLIKIDRIAMKKFLNKHYVANNSVISVVGNFSYKELISKIEDKFSGWEKNLPNQKNSSNNNVTYNFMHEYKQKNIEQTHLCLGFRGFNLNSELLYPMYVLNNIFGGSMSSRLFQKIREDHGLVYSIYSYPSVYEDAGLFNIYAGLAQKNLSQVCSLLSNELKDISKTGFTYDELKKSQEQLKGSYIISLESTSSRMSAMGKSELLLNKTYTQNDIIQKIDDVTMEDIDLIIREIINFENLASTTISKEDESDKVKKYLNM
ncbi:pitrilysin family protein [Serpentinicella sp. ANB-PHB4]|uniref:M16 family metallopeptidase n=1 Tax=Serpentinicella sp. ANB-PHB4 TaxID=3074076 RepID=UPI002864853D|nr:pitrilysin family protein [Serpentinicella sp. ANB-PHB4]MDR5658212.1 pitrilysin family protein [Serpentinicella sp. ANB-PHB4]